VISRVCSQVIRDLSQVCMCGHRDGRAHRICPFFDALFGLEVFHAFTLLQAQLAEVLQYLDNGNSTARQSLGDAGKFLVVV